MKQLLRLFISAAFLTHLQAQQPPNFVVLIADDINYNDLGCTGNPQVRTPHIDALAEEGMNFTNAFLTASSCSPSRVSMITGRYPHNNGPAAELHRPFPHTIPSITTTLADHGYYTALAGKHHMPTNTKEGQTQNYPFFHKVYEGRVQGNSGGHANWIKAIDERDSSKPFFLWLAAYDAHRVWDGNREWDEEAYGPKYEPDEVLLPPSLPDSPKSRFDFASYLNEVTRFDHFVGKVINCLKEQNLFENTYLFVLTDNGRPFHRAKTRLHDDGMKTYFIVSGPGISKKGSVSDSLVSVIDMTATIHDLASLPPMPSLQGRTLSPVFADPAADIRPYAFSEHNWHDYEALGRSVRDQRWLFIQNDRPQFTQEGPADAVKSVSFQELRKAKQAGRMLPPIMEDVFLAPRPEVELYDRAADPFQISNLADDPRYQEKREELASALAYWREETGDTTPGNITPDFFSRKTGTLLNLPNEQFTTQRQRLASDQRKGLRKDPPGTEKQAHQINHEGLKASR